MTDTALANWVLVPVVAGVIIKKDALFLLVEEKEAPHRGLWSFPAGRVEVGESLEQAAIREAREESGYEVRLGRKLLIHQPTAAEAPKHVFEAEIVGGEPGAGELRARWFSQEEIRAMRGSLRGPVLEILEDVLARSPSNAQGPV